MIRVSAGMFVIVLAGALGVVCQAIKAKVEVIDASTRVSVSAEFADPTFSSADLSFVDSFAGNDRLAERIDDVRLVDLQGKSVPFKRLSPAEYKADRPFHSFTYTIDLAAEKFAASAYAHISWRQKNDGTIFLNDVLPRALGGRSSAADVELILPPSIGSQDTEAFSFRDRYAGVFHLAPTGEFRKIASRPDLEIAGTWNFDDASAAADAGAILGEYIRIFGDSPGDVRVVVRHFPVNVPVGTWEADTRGRTVTIFSADAAFKSQSLASLDARFRHELLHIWLPAGVELTGNYDWFYEGTALYMSLRVGLALGQIRMEDYLNTLSSAAAIDAFETRRLWLVDASGRRWSGLNNYIYARGLLAAFLIDISRLKATKGTRSIEDILREIYLKYRPPAQPSDGNAAILDELGRYPDLAPVVARAIRSTEKVDLAPFLDGTGMHLSPGRDAKIELNEKLRGREKAILNKLGYNNWRKLVDHQ